MIELSFATYILFNELTKGITCDDLLLFAVLADFEYESWDYLPLHGHITTKDAHSVVEYVAILAGVALV